jgi:hypothetical protein
MKSVYSAVRTGSLNKAVCASSVNGYLRTNSELYHLQHKLIGLYNPDEKCLQRGTDWFFKYSSLRFVCKRLNKYTGHIRDVTFIYPLTKSMFITECTGWPRSHRTPTNTVPIQQCRSSWWSFIKPFPERSHHLGHGLSRVMSLTHPHTCHQTLLDRVTALCQPLGKHN